MQGETIKAFRLTAQLGAGGMGEVWARPRGKPGATAVGRPQVRARCGCQEGDPLCSCL